jgi:transcriptional regulator with XRE-family HTH domain
MSTNFLANLEAGNTWVSALTLIKLARAFDIEVYELLKPDIETSSSSKEKKNDASRALLERFSADLTVCYEGFRRKVGILDYFRFWEQVTK